MRRLLAVLPDRHDASGSVSALAEAQTRTEVLGAEEVTGTDAQMITWKTGAHADLRAAGIVDYTIRS